jgi:hypothetical protein
MQAGSADFMYAVGIKRIRHLYLEYAPQMQSYFILSAHDDRAGTLGQEAMHTSLVAGLLIDGWHDRRDQ